MSLTPKPLFISAAEFETQAFAKAGFPCFYVGMGALNAAKTANTLRKVAVNQDVVFVGTAGVFGEFSEPLLVRAHKAVWSPVCERHGLSYTVKGTAPDIALPPPHPFAEVLPPATVMVSPTISLDPFLPQRGDENIVVENLELYSVAQELIEVSRTLTIILGITNAIGTNAHSEWRANFAKAADMTFEFVKDRWLLR